jgi:hypothetical protein
MGNSIPLACPSLSEVEGLYNNKISNSLYIFVSSPAHHPKLDALRRESVEATMFIYRLQSAFVIFDCEAYAQQLFMTLPSNDSVFNNN